jgi:hypothetical protein
MPKQYINSNGEKMKLVKKSTALAGFAAVFLMLVPSLSATEGEWSAGGSVVPVVHHHLSTLMQMFSTLLMLVRL